jgi:CDP-diacylglycerol--glycerol-3-phosphate 3-phosphatidyltransferase
MTEKEIDKESRAYKFAAGKGVMNLPNKLTISRVIMIPIFVAFFYVYFVGHAFVALAVFALACLTDFFDGRIARKYNLVTNLGKFLDPIADKVLVSTAMILLLTKAYIFTINLGEWACIVAGICVAVILGRELIVSGFRMVASNAGIVIAADKIGKYKTATQDFSIVILLVFVGFYEIFGNTIAVQVLNYVGLALFALATILTIISGINYIVKNKQVLKA